MADGPVHSYVGEKRSPETMV